MKNESRKDFPGLPFDDTEGCVAAVGQSDEVDDPETFCAWLDEEGKDALSDPQAEEILTGLEVEFVSAVDVPAQDSEWLIAKNAEDPRGDTHRWQTETPLLVTKHADTDDDRDVEKDEDDVKQIAFAPVLVPGEADKQGDVIPSHEIEEAAHKYLAEYRKVDSDHDLLEGKGKPVESWTLKQDTTFDLPGGDGSREYPEGTWIMGIKFDDETWKRVAEGELNGLSIYGGARPIDVGAILGDEATQEASGKSTAKTANNEPMKNEDEEETTESTSKGDVDGSNVSAMLGAYKEYVGEQSAKANEATVEDFVKYLLDNDKVSEDEVKNLDVFLGVGDKADDEDEEDDEDADDEEDDEIDLDVDDSAKDEDGDTADESDDAEKDVDEADVEDEDDVEKSADEDEEAPPWAEGLVDRVESLEKKVDDIPASPRMDLDESDRLATIKSIFGVEDDDEAEVIRKGIVEQADDTDGGVTISFDGITDDEGADATAKKSNEDGASGRTAAQNGRMAGLDD